MYTSELILSIWRWDSLHTSRGHITLHYPRWLHQDASPRQICNQGRVCLCWRWGVNVLSSSRRTQLAQLDACWPHSVFEVKQWQFNPQLSWQWLQRNRGELAISRLQHNRMSRRKWCGTKNRKCTGGFFVLDVTVVYNCKDVGCKKNSYWTFQIQIFLRESGDANRTRAKQDFRTSSRFQIWCCQILSSSNGCIVCNLRSERLFVSCVFLCHL